MTKIAFAVEEDGSTISAHFGRAEAYLVVELEADEVVSREIRPKRAAHGHHQAESAAELPAHQCGCGHQNGDQHEHNHQQMVDPILDCQLLIARGMGMGAHGKLMQAGIRSVLTEHKLVQQALQALRDGTLENRPERLHIHPARHN